MRVAVFLLGLVVLTAPGVASAQGATKGGTVAEYEQAKAKIEAKIHPPAGLRGSVSPESQASAIAGVPPATPLKPGPTPLATPIASAAPDGGQCRLACAHSYYFCLSEPGAADCAQTWSQCLTPCAHPVTPFY